MTSISSTLPSFAAMDAQIMSSEAEDTNTQTDEFSALLGSLIVPVAPPIPPTCPTAPVEAQSSAGTVLEAITSPAAASAQPYEFFAQNSPLSNDSSSSASTGAVKLNSIFEQLGLDQNSQTDQKLPALTREANFSDKVNPTENKVNPTENVVTDAPIQMPMESDKTMTTTPIQTQTESNQTVAELPAQPQKIESKQVQPQTLPADKLSPTIKVEAPKMTTDSSAWHMHHLLELDFSPSRGIPANFAATINSLRESAETPANNQTPSDITGTKADTAPFAAELLQATVSSETGAQTGASDSGAKDSIAPQIAIEGASKSGKTRSSDLQFSTETVPAQNAVTPHATVQEPAAQVTQSVATQVSHALSQVAGEVLAHREPRSIRIRLRPEELGEVHINLTTDASGHLSAQISAEHDATRHIIAGGLDHLRETLEKAGINVDQLNVSVNQYTSSGTGAQSEAGSQQAARQSAIAAQTTSSLTESLSEGKPSPEEDRLLNVRA